MFPIFLFLVVFSFYCCLAYELQQLSDQQQRPEIAATKITPSVQPTVAFPVQLDNENIASQTNLIVAPAPAPTPDVMLQAEDREAIPIALSPIPVEAPLALEERTLLALEITVTETTEEPVIILNHAEEVALNDIAGLKIRSARKVASALGIKQKTNGKDKPLNWLQRELIQKLESHQEQLIQALLTTKQN